MTKRYFRDGTEATDEILERMAAEAEAGYDITTLKVRPGPGGRPRMGSAPAEVVPVRMDPELKLAVTDRAEQEQTSVSEVVREALRRYLAAS
jgi:hypothetical protein